jgi:two-component sensor histidine kinase
LPEVLTGIPGRRHAFGFTRIISRDDAAAIVSTSEFISGLCNELRTSMIGLRPVVVRMEIEDHDVLHDRAVSIGLIVNECLTNALKYAFPDDRAGTVVIRFAREGDTFVLLVKDDGIGIAFEQPRSSGTGLAQRLIRSMVAQLEGTYDIRPDAGDPGTIVTVRFPAR